MASTYPLEIVQLQQWLAKNPGLKDKALADAVAKQPWDPSIQSMAALPDVVKRLGDDIQWTTELGNAFLAQQSDVMDAVQRMRKKAEGTGALKTNEQQKVETKVVEQKTVIVVEQANPRGRLRSLLQPGRRLRPAGLRVPADLLPAPPSTGRRRRGRHDLVRRRHDDRRRVGRRLGLRLRLGPQRHQRQRQQQLQPEHQHQPEHRRQRGGTTGITIPSTAAALRMRTRRPPTSTAGRPAATRSSRQASAGSSRARRRGRRDPVGGRRRSSAPAADRSGRPERAARRRSSQSSRARRSQRRRRSGRKPGRRSEQKLGRLQRLRQLRRLQRRERPGQQRERVFERGLAGRRSVGGGGGRRR